MIRSRYKHNHHNSLKEYIWHPAGNLLSRQVQSVLTLLFFLLIFYKTGAIFKPFLFPDINSYGYPEMLIDFSGGFVRRGLLGEIIHRFAVITGISPLHIIRIICMAAFTFVAIYFFRRFRQGNLNWWLLLSPLMLSSINDIIRKDFLLIALLIAIYELLRYTQPSDFKIFFVILLSALGIFLHEAFLFWGIPVAMLTLLSKKNTRRQGIIGTLILIGLFFMMTLFKGNERQGLAIIDGWHSFPDLAKLEFRSSIGALAWDTRQTFAKHIYKNFCNGYSPWFVVPIRLLMMLCIYYLLSNFLFTFHNINHDTPESEKTAFSALLLFSLLCLLPMFTILSCDYGRLYQYVSFSTVGAYITLEHSQLINLFPSRVLRSVASFNAMLTQFVKPRAALMVIMLIIISPSPIFFMPLSAVQQSIAGILIYYTYRAFSIISDIMMP